MITLSSSRTRRRLPIPDLSAMSALGLMLVNFFMLQQMWEKPQVLPLVTPDHNPHGCMDFPKEIKFLTLLCGREKVYTYGGLTDPVLDSVDYSASGLRRLIIQHKQRVASQLGLDEYTDLKTGLSKRGTFLNVVIKPLPSATYGNIVDVLDEMGITSIRYYLLMDPQPSEIAFIQNPAAGLQFTSY